MAIPCERQGIKEFTLLKEFLMHNHQLDLTGLKYFNSSFVFHLFLHGIIKCLFCGFGLDYSPCTVLGNRKECKTTRVPLFTNKSEEYEQDFRIGRLLVSECVYSTG